MRDGVTSPARPAWIPVFAGMTERGAEMAERGAGMTERAEMTCSGLDSDVGRISEA